MYFTTLELHRTVNTMICFEEHGTNQILSFGFNKITSHYEKITESIDKEIF
jgi:hypothetical protein